MGGVVASVVVVASVITAVEILYKCTKNFINYFISSGSSRNSGKNYYQSDYQEKQRYDSQQYEREEAARQERKRQEYQREEARRQERKRQEYQREEELRREREIQEYERERKRQEYEREALRREREKQGYELEKKKQEYELEEARRRQRERQEYEREEAARVAKMKQEQIRQDEVNRQKRERDLYIQQQQDEADRQQRKREEWISDMKDREVMKLKMVSEIQQQSKKLAVTLENCQETVKSEMQNVSGKFHGMAASLDQRKTQMTNQQKSLVEKTKKDFEKYPKIHNDISESITDLKQGFNPDKAVEFLITVGKIEDRMGTLSTFVNELEESIRIFNEVYQYIGDQDFKRIKQSIEIGKQAIIDKFGIRENRYKALKQSLTKDGQINLGRLMNKACGLSFSPSAKRKIEELEENWEDSQKDSKEYSSFFNEFEQIVKDKYLSSKNLDKMLSRLN